MLGPLSTLTVLTFSSIIKWSKSSLRKWSTDYQCQHHVGLEPVANTESGAPSQTSGIESAFGQDLQVIYMHTKD